MNQSGSVIILKNQNWLYIGHVKDKEPHGLGYEWKEDSDIEYYGEFADGQKHGLGVLIKDSTPRYAGQWFGNMRSGVGVAYYADGSTFQGHFWHGYKHGVGCLHSDSTYCGEWQGDIPHEVLHECTSSIVDHKDHRFNGAFCTFEACKIALLARNTANQAHKLAQIVYDMVHPVANSYHENYNGEDPLKHPCRETPDIEEQVNNLATELRLLQEQAAGVKSDGEQLNVQDQIVSLQQRLQALYHEIDSEGTRSDAVPRLSSDNEPENGIKGLNVLLDEQLFSEEGARPSKYIEDSESFGNQTLPANSEEMFKDKTDKETKDNKINVSLQALADIASGPGVSNSQKHQPFISAKSVVHLEARENKAQHSENLNAVAQMGDKYDNKSLAEAADPLMDKEFVSRRQDCVSKFDLGKQNGSQLANSEENENMVRKIVRSVLQLVLENVLAALPNVPCLAESTSPQMQSADVEFSTDLALSRVNVIGSTCEDTVVIKVVTLLMDVVLHNVIETLSLPEPANKSNDAVLYGSALTIGGIVFGQIHNILDGVVAAFAEQLPTSSVFHDDSLAPVQQLNAKTDHKASKVSDRADPDNNEALLSTLVIAQMLVLVNNVVANYVQIQEQLCSSLDCCKCEVVSHLYCNEVSFTTEYRSSNTTAKALMDIRLASSELSNDDLLYQCEIQASENAVLLPVIKSHTIMGIVGEQMNAVLEIVVAAFEESQTPAESEEHQQPSSNNMCQVSSGINSMKSFYRIPGNDTNELMLIQLIREQMHFIVNNVVAAFVEPSERNKSHSVSTQSLRYMPMEIDLFSMPSANHTIMAIVSGVIDCILKRVMRDFAKILEGSSNVDSHMQQQCATIECAEPMSNHCNPSPKSTFVDEKILTSWVATQNDVIVQEVVSAIDNMQAEKTSLHWSDCEVCKISFDPEISLERSQAACTQKVLTEVNDAILDVVTGQLDIMMAHVLATLATIQKPRFYTALSATRNESRHCDLDQRNEELKEFSTQLESDPQIGYALSQTILQQIRCWLPTDSLICSDEHKNFEEGQNFFLDWLPDVADALPLLEEASITLSRSPDDATYDTVQGQGRDHIQSFLHFHHNDDLGIRETHHRVAAMASVSPEAVLIQLILDAMNAGNGLGAFIRDRCLMFPPELTADVIVAVQRQLMAAPLETDRDLYSFGRVPELLVNTACDDRTGITIAEDQNMLVIIGKLLFSLPTQHLAIINNAFCSACSASDWKEQCSPLPQEFVSPSETSRFSETLSSLTTELYRLPNLLQDDQNDHFSLESESTPIIERSTQTSYVDDLCSTNTGVSDPSNVMDFGTREHHVEDNLRCHVEQSSTEDTECSCQAHTPMSTKNDVELLCDEIVILLYLLCDAQADHLAGIVGLSENAVSTALRRHVRRHGLESGLHNESVNDDLTMQPNSSGESLVMALDRGVECRPRLSGEEASKCVSEEGIVENSLILESDPSNPTPALQNVAKSIDKHAQDDILLPVNNIIRDVLESVIIGVEVETKLGTDSAQISSDASSRGQQEPDSTDENSTYEGLAAISDRKCLISDKTTKALQLGGEFNILAHEKQRFSEPKSSRSPHVDKGANSRSSIQKRSIRPNLSFLHQDILNTVLGAEFTLSAGPQLEEFWNDKHPGPSKEPQITQWEMPEMSEMPLPSNLIGTQVKKTLDVNANWEEGGIRTCDLSFSNSQGKSREDAPDHCCHQSDGLLNVNLEPASNTCAVLSSWTRNRLHSAIIKGEQLLTALPDDTSISLMKAIKSDFRSPLLSAIRSEIVHNLVGNDNDNDDDQNNYDDNDDGGGVDEGQSSCENVLVARKSKLEVVKNVERILEDELAVSLESQDEPSAHHFALRPGQKSDHVLTMEGKQLAKMHTLLPFPRIIPPSEASKSERMFLKYKFEAESYFSLHNVPDHTANVNPKARSTRPLLANHDKLPQVDSGNFHNSPVQQNEASRGGSLSPLVQRRLKGAMGLMPLSLKRTHENKERSAGKSPKSAESFNDESLPWATHHHCSTPPVSTTNGQSSSVRSPSSPVSPVPVRTDCAQETDECLEESLSASLACLGSEWSDTWKVAGNDPLLDLTSCWLGSAIKSSTKVESLHSTAVCIKKSPRHDRLRSADRCKNASALSSTRPTPPSAPRAYGLSSQHSSESITEGMRNFATPHAASMSPYSMTVFTIKDKDIKHSNTKNSAPSTRPNTAQSAVTKHSNALGTESVRPQSCTSMPKRRPSGHPPSYRKILNDPNGLVVPLLGQWLRSGPGST